MAGLRKCAVPPQYIAHSLWTAAGMYSQVVDTVAGTFVGKMAVVSQPGSSLHLDQARAVVVAPAVASCSDHDRHTAEQRSSGARCH